MREVVVKVSLGVGVLVLGAACEAGSQPGPRAEEGRVVVNIDTCAPGALEVCYDVEVRASGQAGELLASRTGCRGADELGDGLQVELACQGDEVEVAVRPRVTRSEVEHMVDFADPCAAGACSQVVACRAAPAEPVGVDLDLRFVPTRPAALSYAERFGPTFCSAGAELMDAFLHDEEDVRRPTLVVAFRCGLHRFKSDGELHLYAQDVEVSCASGASWRFDPTARAASLEGLAFKQATYVGGEVGLGPLGERDTESIYWNVALGLRADASGARLAPELGALGACELRATMAVTLEPLERGVDGAFVTPVGVPTPIIEVAVPVTADGALVPFKVDLDRRPTVDAECAPQGAVVATHTSLEGLSFCHHLDAALEFESCAR